MPASRKPKAAVAKAAQASSKAKAAQPKPENELKAQQEAVAAKAKKAGKPEEKPAAKRAKPEKTKSEKAKPEKTKPAVPPQAKAEPAKAKQKPKKAKLVRDSFTMPENEYQVIGEIKKACLGAGFSIKKSEVLRIGVALLQKMTPAQIQQSLSGLPALKAGRPKKEDEARPSAG